MTARTIDKPGIYDLSREEYDADPAPTASLNASTAKIILDRSPRHAWLQHPRLNPKYERDRDRKFDLGTATHDLVLNAGRNIAIVAADDYKTKAAQAARDDSIAAGKMPLTLPQHETAQAMARAVRAQLVRHEDLVGILDHGKSEQTLVWQEGETWCRSCVDWLPAGGNVVVDFKTTGVSANPDKWQRTGFDQGIDVQAAFYLRGLRAVTKKDWHFRFIVVETDPPYALSVIGLSPAALALGDSKVEHALGYWRWCLAHDKWPGYARETAYIDAPAWEDTKHMARLERENIAKEQGAEMLQRLIDWQAPEHMKGKAA